MPDAFWTRLTNLFRLSNDESALSKVREISQFNAKTPGMPFEKDREQKQISATEKMRELAALHLEPIYRQLEANRIKNIP